MSKFVIENWSAVSPQIPDPSTIIVDAKGMAEFVSDATNSSTVKIRIFEVSDCIFDSTQKT